MVAVPKAHRPYLNASGTVSFTVRSLPQATFTGRIKRQASAVDQRLRSVRVELAVLRVERRRFLSV
ncbi:hypothetical protein [Hymenobacter sp. IS2118]|uniref:hypothetical protein n=1 Tax=Hymenobacter sp. IS2118 TaxID=1505605 RepID=UPI000556F174|nr:hypothetical protein [Hymenobacter sp. IS2118]